MLAVKASRNLLIESCSGQAQLARFFYSAAAYLLVTIRGKGLVPDGGFEDWRRSAYLP